MACPLTRIELRPIGNGEDYGTAFVVCLFDGDGKPATTQNHKPLTVTVEQLLDYRAFRAAVLNWHGRLFRHPEVESCASDREAEGKWLDFVGDALDRAKV